MQADAYEKRGESKREEQTHLEKERKAIRAYVRRFLDIVESLISINQLKEFEKLTRDCKAWIRRELRETTKALDYLLTEDQIMKVKIFSERLDLELESVV